MLNYCSLQSVSLWQEIALPDFFPLKQDLKTEICIVGGGFVGLMCAYHLAKEGKKVTLVEQKELGQGQTARTTAHLSLNLEQNYTKLKKLFGEEKTKLIIESQKLAIDTMEAIIHLEKIECDFERVPGYLFSPSNQPTEELIKEFNTLKELFLEVDLLKEKFISETFNLGQCIEFPKQAQFHPLKFLKGLIKALLRYDVKIFTHTSIVNFKEGSPCQITSDEGFKITAEQVIIATCTPVNNRYFIHTKQAAYRSYVIAGVIPKGSVEKALYWDTENPYHYIRLQPHATDETLDWLIIGGEDHKVGQEEEKLETGPNELLAWTMSRFPMFKRSDFQWSGQIYEPIDALGFIGKNPHDENTYIVTGDSGSGLTHGAIAATIITDLIQKRDNSFSKLYSPNRKTLGAYAKFIQENLNTAWQYKDLLTPGDQEEINQLGINEALILRKGIKKIAAYKDSQEKLHLNSALCPHLGACVRWNALEKSWDCPAHGSRFTGEGEVIDGPSYCSLSSKSQL